MADLYQLLAVSPGASPDELRAAYRRLLKRHHPDQFPTGTPAHRRASGVTRALVAAWDVLGEPASRRAYDATLVGGRSCVSVPAGAPSRPSHRDQGQETSRETGRETGRDERRSAPAPQQRRVEQRYVEAHGPARLREVGPPAGDQASELLVRALRQVVAGASGSTGQVAEELYAAAVAELPGVRSRATPGTADRSVAAAALATARRELGSRGQRPRPLLDAVAEEALRALDAASPAGLLAGDATTGRATARGTTAGALRTLMWVAAAVWLVLTSQLLGDPQPTTSAWLHDVALSAALGATVIGPWWFLARAVRPQAVPGTRSPLTPAGT